MMEGVDIDVHGLRLDHARRHVGLFQDRYDFQGLACRQTLDTGSQAANFVFEARKLIQLVLARDVERRPRGKKLMLRESLGLCEKEGAACAREAPNHAVSIGFQELGGRASGRVIAGLAFSLQHNDRARGRQFVCR